MRRTARESSAPSSSLPWDHAPRLARLAYASGTGIETVADHLVAVAEHGDVHGEAERLVAGGGGALHELTGEGRVGLDVQLEPAPAVRRRLRDGLERVRATSWTRR